MDPNPSNGAAPGRTLTPYVYLAPRAGWEPLPAEPEPVRRVGERERATACDALAEHFAAGRLDPAELDERLARAVAARTQADLRALFADLGPRRPAPGAEREVAPAEPRPLRLLAPVAVPLLVLSLMLAGGMLVVLGAVNPALFLAALVGGTATAVAGGCATVLTQAAWRRR